MKHLLIIACLFFSCYSFGQEICVDLSIPATDQIQVGYLPNSNYNTPPLNFWENQLLTISWDQSLGNSVISSLSNQSVFSFSLDGSPILDGSNYYQKITYTGTTQILTLSTGVTTPVLIINLTGGTSGTFSVSTSPPISGGDLAVNNSVMGNQADVDYSIGCTQSVNIVTLPVELSKFTVNLWNETDALLNWTTDSELNTSHFEIQRSFDGNEWARVGEEEAVGNSSITNQYLFIDELVPAWDTHNPLAYYRLKIIDFDDSFEYSSVEVVSFEKSESKIKVFPTIVKDELHIQLQSNSLIDAQLEIYNLQGQKVFEETLNINSFKHTLNLAKLTSGQYFIRVLIGKGFFTTSIVKQK